MHEGVVSMRLGLRGMACRRRGSDHPPRHRAGPAHRRPAAHHATCPPPRRGVDTPGPRKRGVRVTAEACPQHFFFTDKELLTYDSNFKMNPPLRTEDDVAALIAGLKMARSMSLPAIIRRRPRRKSSASWTWPPSASSAWKRCSRSAVITLIEPGHLSWPQLIRKAHPQSGKILASNAALWSRGGRGHHHHRSPRRMDHRRRALPLQAPQFALRRPEGARRPDAVIVSGEVK